MNIRLVKIIVGVALSFNIVTSCSLNGLPEQSNLNQYLPSASSNQPLAKAEYWRWKYQKEPENTTFAINFAQALYRIGSSAKAEEVLRDALDKNDKDKEITIEYARILTKNGKMKKAAHILKRAHYDFKPDWRIYLARGIVFDSMQDHDSARKMYTKALTLQPNQIKIMNNLAMSYLLEGNLIEAENIFNRTIEIKTDDVEIKSKVRQNLAIAIALQGRFKEAQRIISNELSPEEARENIAYIRKIVGNRASWKKLGKIDSKYTNQY